MHCMKCGNEIPDGQVFCEDCLNVMAKYPVKPDTPVQIPKRPARTEKKHSRQISQKEVIRKQAKKIRRLTWIAALLFILLALVAGLYLQTIS